jgi:hypothetical protein
MNVFEHNEFDHHEQVLFCHDERVNLRAIIAIHSTALGPAAGGCRMYPYASVQAALTDVLRLSKVVANASSSPIHPSRTNRTFSAPFPLSCKTYMESSGQLST